MRIPLDHLQPNPEQPRTIFDPAELEALAASLRKDGLLTPIAVEKSGNGSYIIIDGERRWRAAKLAGWTSIEVYVHSKEENSAEERLSLALVANLQRGEMPPIDEAEAYLRLQDEYGLSQTEIAKRVGRSQTHISNRFQLLTFPVEIRQAINAGRLPAVFQSLKPVQSLDAVQMQAFIARLRNRPMTANQVRAICMFLRRKEPIAEPTRRKMKTAQSTECPPLQFVAAGSALCAFEAEFHYICGECGMYEGKGYEQLCPECPLVDLVKIISEGIQ